jgi:hypothetical protein
MRPGDDSGSGPLEVQAVYSLAALARFARVSRHALRRILRSSGVVLLNGGRSLFVPLSEIERKIPPLWESIRLAERTRCSARRSDRGPSR